MVALHYLVVVEGDLVGLVWRLVRTVRLNVSLPRRLLLVPVDALVLRGCLALAVVDAALGVDLVPFVVGPDEEVAERVRILLQSMAVL